MNPEVKDSPHEEAGTKFYQIREDLPTINAYSLGSVGPLSIATSTLTVALISLFFIALAFKASRSKLIPSKFQVALEMFYGAVAEFITSIVGAKDKAEKIIPYVGALMAYLLVANLLPMVPGISSFYVTSQEGAHIPLFRGATTDFNTTFGLALAVVVTMQVVGIREQGFFGYMSHFIQIKQVWKGFKKGLGEGTVSIIGFFVGLIEIISEIAKVLSLSLRLFGNLFAHEVLTVILLGTFAFVIPAVWMGMGLLVGVVQSIVFVALVTVYYSLVLKQEGKDH